MEKLPSFKESIIIPLELYQKKCKPDQVVKTSDQLLSRSDLPSDLRLKLYNQAKWNENRFMKKDPKTDSHPTDWQQNKEQLLKRIPLDNIPYIKSILELFVAKNRDVVDWIPNTYELVIEGEKLPETHLLQILHYLLRPENKSMPAGTIEFRRKLTEIGVPDNWLFIPKEPIFSPAPNPPVIAQTSPIASRVSKRRRQEKDRTPQKKPHRAIYEWTPLKDLQKKKVTKRLQKKVVIKSPLQPKTWPTRWSTLT